MYSCSGDPFQTPGWSAPARHRQGRPVHQDQKLQVVARVPAPDSDRAPAGCPMPPPGPLRSTHWPGDQGTPQGAGRRPLCRPGTLRRSPPVSQAGTKPPCPCGMDHEHPKHTCESDHHPRAPEPWWKRGVGAGTSPHPTHQKKPRSGHTSASRWEAQRPSPSAYFPQHGLQRPAEAAGPDDLEGTLSADGERQGDLGGTQRPNPQGGWGPGKGEAPVSVRGPRLKEGPGHQSGGRRR